ncbi:MAG TPA: hypothetical protein VGO31_02170 [Microbacteriaceae bacterium]|nr:hypothetical protein [Microbacteriaceae bacterium]
MPPTIVPGGPTRIRSPGDNRTSSMVNNAGPEPALDLECGVEIDGVALPFTIRVPSLAAALHTKITIEISVDVMAE